MNLNLPKKFWRHCWNMCRFVVACSIAKMVLDGLQSLAPIEHYTLISFCLIAVTAFGSGWFVWRAYVGMERDLDFYEEP